LKGFGRGAVSKILEHAFDELKLNRVSIACAVENIASQRIPEALNFKFEGIKREADWLYDHFVDHKIYSLLRSEWLALK
jgi:ribosomal-protein-serine acetyltransferase